MLDTSSFEQVGFPFEIFQQDSNSVLARNQRQGFQETDFISLACFVFVPGPFYKKIERSQPEKSFGTNQLLFIFWFQQFAKFKIGSWGQGRFSQFSQFSKFVIVTDENSKKACNIEFENDSRSRKIVFVLGICYCIDAEKQFETFIETNTTKTYKNSQGWWRMNIKI